VIDSEGVVRRDDGEFMNDTSSRVIALPRKVSRRLRLNIITNPRLVLPKFGWGAFSLLLLTSEYELTTDHRSSVG
jgi:hypothetical protein